MKECLQLNENALIYTPLKNCILGITIATSQFYLTVEFFDEVQQCHVVDVENKFIS
jgi:hypothetical protein